MRRIFKVASMMLVLCAAFVFVGCKRGGNAPSSGKEVMLISNKIEIDAALKGYATVYEKQSGVRINVRSIGGESPYAPNLTAMLNSGTEPEIFVFEGKAGLEDARRGERLTDLSGEPWLSDTDVAYRDPVDGKIVGFPVAVEGWGLGYNKALLAQAGIDPATLVNFAAIKAAFEKIDSMKTELGLDAVVSMAAGPGMTWVTGLHGVNAYLTLGLPYADSARYLDMLNNKQVDAARLAHFANYMELLFKYADRNALLVGGYDEQIGGFAMQKTMFIHQGNWIDPSYKEMGINFDMAYVPHAFLPETTDGIFVGAPSWYLVNAKSNNVDEAKKFLIAMASTPEGHDYMVNKAGMVPAFKSVRLNPEGQLSRSVQEWASLGKIYAWQQNEMPDGFGMDVLGPIFTQLASGQINTDGFVRMFTEAVANIR